MTETQTQQNDEKARKKFRNWYESNREEFNRKRREKYAKNKSLRKKAQQNAKKQRSKTEAPDTEPVKRVIGGRTMRVYRTATAGAMIGRSPETIRTWIRNGWIPESDDGWVHRTFTKTQIGLMRRLANVIEKYRYADDYQQRIDKVVASIQKQW